MAEPLSVAIGISLGIFTVVYLFFSSITIRHAARFRYLSKRTVWLTVFFVATSAILLTLLWAAYVTSVFN